MNKKEFEKKMNEIHQIEVEKGMITNVDQSYAFKVAIEAAYKCLVTDEVSSCVSICHCVSNDWIPFRIEQRVLCGKCNKPIVG